MILGSVFFLPYLLHLFEKSYLFYFFILACCLSVNDVVLVDNEIVDSNWGVGSLVWFVSSILKMLMTT